eukprot:TRINITY_DN21769_c0_g1_i1.p1 TRINITY_DN21769_c0_g1~~TRINITY_DN21769_c0_g1_i1.p1  ORF type:complete len:408 (-),score=56.48 TRINITY_DN21769_c0_g1_i1:35-1177(-)
MVVTASERIVFSEETHSIAIEVPQYQHCRPVLTIAAVGFEWLKREQNGSNEKCGIRQPVCQSTKMSFEEQSLTTPVNMQTRLSSDESLAEHEADLSFVGRKKVRRRRKKRGDKIVHMTRHAVVNNIADKTLDNVSLVSVASRRHALPEAQAAFGSVSEASSVNLPLRVARHVSDYVCGSISPPGLTASERIAGATDSGDDTTEELGDVASSERQTLIKQSCAIRHSIASSQHHVDSGNEANIDDKFRTSPIKDSTREAGTQEVVINHNISKPTRSKAFGSNGAGFDMLARLLRTVCAMQGDVFGASCLASSKALQEAMPSRWSTKCWTRHSRRLAACRAAGLREFSDAQFWWQVHLRHLGVHRLRELVALGVVFSVLKAT